MTREELRDRSNTLRTKLLAMASELERFENDPKFDEDYKLAWSPNLTSKHFDVVEHLVDNLHSTFNVVLKA
jgi:hypothetical protein